MVTKTCSRCGEAKPLEDGFYPSPSYADRHYGWCKSCHNKVGKSWREKNKSHQAENVKAWCDKNIERRRKHKRDWQRKHNRNRSIADKIHDSIRTKVWRQLKGKKRSQSTFALLGYTPEKLMAHLEAQFTEGMSWENYGKWHIDHITAKAKFVIRSVEDEDFKQCWALSNLQPLWALDNLKKWRH